MPIFTAYTEFTAQYSFAGVGTADINSYWLVKGELRVMELLGGHYATPFSSNNLTARDLAVEFARISLLERTRNAEDAEEPYSAAMDRIKALTEGGRPMMTTSGGTIYPSKARNDAWSSTQGYKPVFDLRPPQEQRIDPDRLRDETAEDL